MVPGGFNAIGEELRRTFGAFGLRKHNQAFGSEEVFQSFDDQGQTLVRWPACKVSLGSRVTPLTSVPISERAKFGSFGQ